MSHKITALEKYQRLQKDTRGLYSPTEEFTLEEIQELEASIRKEVVDCLPEERKEEGRTLNEIGEIFGHNMCRLEFLKRLEKNGITLK